MVDQAYARAMNLKEHWCSWCGEPLDILAVGEFVILEEETGQTPLGAGHFKMHIPCLQEFMLVTGSKTREG